MSNNEIYLYVKKTVGKVCGLTDFMRGNVTELVDARYILVATLSSVGFREREIARFTGLSRQGINKIKNLFASRMRGSVTLRRNYREACNEVATIR